MTFSDFKNYILERLSKFLLYDIIDIPIDNQILKQTYLEYCNLVGQGNDKQDMLNHAYNIMESTFTIPVH